MIQTAVSQKSTPIGETTIKAENLEHTAHFIGSSLGRRVLFHNASTDLNFFQAAWLYYASFRHWSGFKSLLCCPAYSSWRGL